MDVEITAECVAAIRRHAEKTFPEECCGTLLGTDQGGVRRVVQVIAVENTKDENRQRRFLIEPRALLDAEKSARAQGLDVVGIYHSHPNHPSQASEFDREHAMPFWSYVIVSCMDGRSEQMQSWRLREDRSQFDEEALRETP